MKTTFRIRHALPMIATWLASTSAFATTLPNCMNHGVILPENDAQVARWKTSTANQFLARAHVTGVIHRLFPDHSGHNHFEIQVDTPTGDTLEIVYNQSFGALPTLHAGMTVEACGDYITSDHATSQYPASPDGAILHWVHNNSGGGSAPAPIHSHSSGHDAGYLAIDGVVYGGY